VKVSSSEKLETYLDPRAHTHGHMLAGVARSGSGAWQGGSLGTSPPKPIRPPSPEVLAKPPVQFPSSNFSVDYSVQSPDSPFKALLDHGEPKVVVSFPQGFSGSAMERYPSGEAYVGYYADARRHGRGVFLDPEGGTLLSSFEVGKPILEGTRVLADPRSEQLVAAVRTYEGKPDGLITLDEAGAIAKNVGLPMPKKHTSLACTPSPKSKRSPKSAGSPSSGGDFLARLAAVDGSPYNKQASSSADDASDLDWVAGMQFPSLPEPVEEIAEWQSAWDDPELLERQQREKDLMVFKEGNKKRHKVKKTETLAAGSKPRNKSYNYASGS